jgi:hypothetical protein
MYQRPARRDRDRDERRNYPGVILLLTLVILVIMSTLGYTLSVRVAARRHRDRYLIDYTQAQYACASALKYALASVGTVPFQLISRPNEPDFSDVFALSEPEYQKLLDQMALKRAADGNYADADSAEMSFDGRTTRVRDFDDFNDFNDVNDPNKLLSRPKDLEIPGPYGPRWPLVTEPIEFEVGTAKVKIEIEDENAKYPLGWMMLADEKRKAEAGAGWKTFCEWMGYSGGEIGTLAEDLVKIGQTKPFKTEFKPEAQTAAAAPPALRGRITPPGSARSAPTRRTVTKRPVPVAEQIEQQNKEFARLFHTTLVNTDLLARRSIESDTRKESALKYVGLWATRQVNVNSAPRHVLEAALAFGSVADAPKIADAIIQHRQTKPIADVNELKQVMLVNSPVIDKCRDFLTVTSTVFTIRITATSGAATATVVAGISREGDQIKRIAVVSD